MLCLVSVHTLSVVHVFKIGDWAAGKLVQRLNAKLSFASTSMQATGLCKDSTQPCPKTQPNLVNLVQDSMPPFLKTGLAATHHVPAD